MAGILKEVGTAYPSQAPQFTPGLLVGSVLLIFLVLSYYVSICSEFRVGHHYTYTNTTNVNKTCSLLQTTGGKDEPNILFMRKS